jgi:hypothetical protein
MKGCWNLPEVTGDTFCRRLVFDWRHRAGRRGRLLLHRRTQEHLIIRDGHNVDPREMENALSGHPAMKRPALCPSRIQYMRALRGRRGINTRKCTCRGCRSDQSPRDDYVSANNDPLPPSIDDHIRRLSVRLRVRTVGDEPAST